MDINGYSGKNLVKIKMGKFQNHTLIKLMKL